jgi:hypothetical protein
VGTGFFSAGPSPNDVYSTFTEKLTQRLKVFDGHVKMSNIKDRFIVIEAALANKMILKSKGIIKNIQFRQYLPIKEEQ